MIKVLQGWDEVGQSYRNLLEHDLPPHERVEKNWDLDVLRELLTESPRATRILDMGCGGLHTLSFLSALGFACLRGVDLHLSLRERTRGLRTALRTRTTGIPFRVRSADLVDTPYAGRSFDAITCISTMEHGVDARAFLTEAHRLLTPRGLLFLTTDYWEPRIDVPRHLRPFGLDWQIYGESAISVFIETAHEVGFDLLQRDASIPSCSEACVYAFGLEYTFIALAFRASDRDR